MTQNVGVLNYGINLVIKKNLSLRSDQSSKFYKAIQDNGTVKEFKLDAVNSEE